MTLTEEVLCKLLVAKKERRRAKANGYIEVQLVLWHKLPSNVTTFMYELFAKNEGSSIFPFWGIPI